MGWVGFLGRMVLLGAVRRVERIFFIALNEINYLCPRLYNILDPLTHSSPNAIIPSPLKTSATDIAAATIPTLHPPPSTTHSPSAPTGAVSAVHFTSSIGIASRIRGRRSSKPAIDIYQLPQTNQTKPAHHQP